MENTIYNNQNARIIKKGSIYEPQILQASQVVSLSIAKEKIKQLVALEEKILALSLALPHDFSLFPISFSKDKAKISIMLDTPLFYKEEMYVFLRYYFNRQVGSEHSLSIDTNCRLTFDIFSDKELQNEFRKFTKNHSAKTKFYPETSYLFDKQGHYAKVIRLPSEIQVNRVVVADYDLEKDYLSKMTTEDFILVERALTLLNQQFEDYLKWSKLQIIA